MSSDQLFAIMSEAELHTLLQARLAFPTELSSSFNTRSKFGDMLMNHALLKGARTWLDIPCGLFPLTRFGATLGKWNNGCRDDNCPINIEQEDSAIFSWHSSGLSMSDCDLHTMLSLAAGYAKNHKGTFSIHNIQGEETRFFASDPRLLTLFFEKIGVVWATLLPAWKPTTESWDFDLLAEIVCHDARFC